MTHSQLPTADIRAAAVAIEARARAMAAAMIETGDNPNASETEKVLVDVASLAIEYATKRADLVPAEEAERILASAADGDELISNALDHAKLAETTATSLGEVIGHAVALLDVDQARFGRWVAEHRLKVWTSAMVQLSTLGRPMTAETSERSEARH